MTLAISLFVHGEAVRFNRGKKDNSDKFDFKYMTGSDGTIYPYVSSQCFKRYWRESLPTPPSPITRMKTGKTENHAFTDGNPIDFVDDDLFGYMIAGAKDESDELQGEPSDEGKIESPEQIDSTDESLFEAGDINDPNAFLGKLRETENPYSKYLMNRFSEESKQLLNQHNIKAQMPTEVEIVLVEELNKILNSELYQQSDFGKKVKKSDTKELGTDPQGKNRLYLNSQLLERVFGKEISKKAKKRNTTKRTAPIRMHALLAFSGIKTAKDFQVLSRDSSLNGKDSVLNPNPPGIYSGWLKTRILIEEHHIGKFYVGKNMDILEDQLQEKSEIREEVNPYSRTGEKVRFHSIDPAERNHRFSLAVRSLADVGNRQGPASGALHDGSLKPKTFIAAFMKCADSPFDYVWRQDQNGQPRIDIQKLKNSINDWNGLFEKNTIYIGMPVDADEKDCETLKVAIAELDFSKDQKFVPQITTPRQALLKLADDIYNEPTSGKA